jgi:hypothetical protein
MYTSYKPFEFSKVANDHVLLREPFFARNR